MTEATWNVLHDGSLDTIEGTLPGDLRLSIGISYLCQHLPTQAEHVVVTLVGCEQFEYRPWDEETPVKDLFAIAAISLDILSADPAGDRLNIACGDRSSGGYLVARYTEACITTLEGQPLTQSEVELAADEYWTNWRRGNAARRSQS